MLNNATLDQVSKLADDLLEQFAPPEYIPGCQVIDLSDKDFYATNNGWIEAIASQHNQQRCRWKGQFDIAVGDFVDVLYFRSYRLFVVMAQGGEDAIKYTIGEYLVDDNSDIITDDNDALMTEDT